MMNTTSKVALATVWLLAVPSVIQAQTATDNSQTVTQGEQEMQPSATDPAAQNEDQGGAEQATADRSPGTQAEQSQAEAAPEPIDGQVVLQAENTILTEDFIGLPVYSPDGNEIGKVNNLIFSLNGPISGVVIGVGGFLGLGEKNVAMQPDKLTVTSLEPGTFQLVLSSTAEELEAAPAFKTLARQEQDRQVEASRRMQMQNSLNQGTAPPATSSNQ